MDTSVHQIKSRTAALGLKNNDIIRMLREEGWNVTPPQYSSAINSYIISPKSLELTSRVNEILTKLEGERECRTR